MYYIYHIKGVKIGCTDDLERRISQQNFTHYEVLETHTDIYEASNRELKLQKQYGYPVDRIPYFKSVERWGAKAGKIGGKNAQKTLRENKLAIYGFSKERRQQISSKAGRIAHQKHPNLASEMGKKSTGGLNAKIHCSKRVYQFDKNNNFVKSFNSLTEASKSMNVSITAIYNCIYGKTKTCKGFVWKYDI